MGKYEKILYVRGLIMNEKDVDDMPIWQNHEQRITTLEVLTSNMQGEFKEVKDKIDTGNEDQSKQLEMINKRLFEEFFPKKASERNNKWKFWTTILGGGGLIYLLVDKVISLF